MKVKANNIEYKKGKDAPLTSKTAETQTKSYDNRLLNLGKVNKQSNSAHDFGLLAQKLQQKQQ